MEYIVISDTAGKGICDTSKLSTLVNQKLAEGYELYGNVGALFEPEHKTVIDYQALTKK